MKKFYIHTMGCKSNQFESLVIEENLIKNGLVKTENITETDYYILNSCTVTHKSDNEALYLLRNAKHKNPSAVIILTGCIAQVEKDKLLQNDFIDCVVGNDEKLELYKYIISGDKLCVSDIMGKIHFHNAVLTDTSKTRASIKIQDGCDNRCSYCIIPFARGKSRSADTNFIIEQINNFSKRGYKEVVLTGIHIGQWGHDIDSNLLRLLQKIEEKTDIKRYRLGSLNPSEITDEMLDFLQRSDKFCPHFHLSLQSACDKTLRSMNRFYKTDEYLKQIDKINDMFDLPFLGSDIITGFADETDEDFDITSENLRKSGLTQIHTFPYSVRKGTKGAESTNQVDEKTRESRAAVIKGISKEKLDNFIRKNINRKHEILIEKHPDKNTGYLKAMTRNYLTVILNSKDVNLSNTLNTARITNHKNGKIYAELIN